MLTITPLQISTDQVVLDKNDFDALIQRLSNYDQVIVKKNEGEFSLQELQDSLQEIWDNPGDEAEWKKYM